MRRLVVCCDGTWEDPSSNTNVHIIATRLAAKGQLRYYRAGVGTGRPGASWLWNTWDAIVGGAFGAGLSGNVKDAYRWIAENYEPGDSLWFFGFSRGAFTVRSTVGFIRKVGLLPSPVDPDALDAAYELYRRADPDADPSDAVDFRARHGCRPIDDINIAFLGVWDTVGALGIPGGFFGRISRRRWGFHDYRLSSHVKHAYQALAVDELRAAYLAALWTGPIDEGQRVEQRWFPGRHSDVGGSRGERPLAWIAAKAEEAGLAFDMPVSEWPEPQPERARPLELTSRAWRFACGRARRPIGHRRWASQCVDERTLALRERVPAYRPENLERWLDGDPLERPKGRSWWYTLPGANSYYLRQYGAERRE